MNESGEMMEQKSEKETKVKDNGLLFDETPILFEDETIVDRPRDEIKKEKSSSVRSKKGGLGSTSQKEDGSSIGEYYQQVLQSAAYRLKHNLNNSNNNNNNNNKHNNRSNSECGPTEEDVLLSSLPQRPVANLPSEEDRKRMIGCLASILSLSSAHESYFLDQPPTHHPSSASASASASSPHRDGRRGVDDSMEEDENASLLPVGDSSSSSSGGGKSSKVNGSFYVKRSQEKQNEILELHLRRRHKVYSDFLLQSTQLLFLDKSHAYAFLPILSRLLLSPHQHLHPPNDPPPSYSRQSSSSSKDVEWGQFQTAPDHNHNSTFDSSPDDHNSNDAHAHPLQDHTPPPTNPSDISEASGTTAHPRPLNTELSLADYLYNSSDDESSCRDCDCDCDTTNHANESFHKPQQDQPITPTTSPVTQETNDSKEDHVHKPCQDDEDPTGNSTSNPSAALATTWYNNPLLQPFLDSLSPGAGIQCVSLLLLQLLLRNSSEGYDARIRHVLKKLAIVIFMHESKPGSNKNMQAEAHQTLALMATRKFEALERGIALRLLHLSQPEPSQSHTTNNNNNNNDKEETRITKPSISSKMLNRDSIVRGLKIGSAGVVAGTLFAVTGGLAAPGIAAGLAALGTTTAATAAVMTTLTSTVTVTTIFGVGGGSLYAYKTHRRTQGLTEFDFTKECYKSQSHSQAKEDNDNDSAELFTTICLSGWLQDNRDFQRPWGVTPSKPPLDRLEKLERFYFIYKPANMRRCSRILHQWKGEERQLWQFLRKKYGRDPDHLFPLRNGPRKAADLTDEEEECINLLLNELGYFVKQRKKKQMQMRQQDKASLPIQTLHSIRNIRSKTSASVVAAIPHATSSHSSFRRTSSATRIHKSNHPVHPSSSLTLSPEHTNTNSNDNTNINTNNNSNDNPTTANNNNSNNNKMTQGKPKVRATAKVWDYFSEFGGELYTVKWESHLLMELCDSVVDIAVDLVHGAAREVLKQTALATLLTAVALPYALVQAAHMIDGTWTLAIERADEAGIELARTLLESQAGHRPVVLVGFSMGARIIYSCLKELARHQRLWEEQHMTMTNQDNQDKDTNNTTTENNDATTVKTSNDDNPIQYRREPASIVEDAILMGIPNHLSVSSWELCRQVVAGRLINCFSRRDLVLSLMFQYKRLALKSVCGTSPINVAGVEDVDVSHLVSSHSDYCLVAGDILRLVGHGQPSYSNSFYNNTHQSNTNNTTVEESMEELSRQSQTASPSKFDTTRTSNHNNTNTTVPMSEQQEDHSELSSPLPPEVKRFPEIKITTLKSEVTDTNERRSRKGPINFSLRSEIGEF